MFKKRMTNNDVAEPKSVREVLAQHDAEQEVRPQEVARAELRLTAEYQAFVDETNRLGAEAASILRKRRVPMRRFLLSTGPAWGTYRNGVGGWQRLRLRADGTLLCADGAESEPRHWTKVTDLPSIYADIDMASLLAGLVKEATEHYGRWTYRSRFSGAWDKSIVPTEEKWAWTVEPPAVDEIEES